MGGRDTDIVLLDEKGIRCDGRKINETRKVSIKAGVLKNANGSAYIEFGENKILEVSMGQETFIQNICLILIQVFCVVDITCHHSQ